ncbi:MAG TPA: glycoside hydrolase family 88 protein [Niabella sp.]|nr:glycoside hydrolase family 88 protein [Niabella sp.]HQW15869.1 glycoside hydrolase family 88 protein [Niabella sp.]HQX21081.1 glycoside hydrolase family 88 protein [Niabella sp.]HQX40902.1 glycoside hydrolase family 88 protein [Niabella sp.]HRB36910.1 glycoside hydrolase family 88 protein [Niabella sp.]
MEIKITHTLKSIFAIIVLGLLISCSTAKRATISNTDDFIKENFSNAEKMLTALLSTANKNFDTKNGAFPRTINKEGKLVTTSMYDWTPGFFPGSLWYTYEFTKNEALKSEAVKWTEKLESLQHFTEHHDLGFMMYCSYGNAYRLANKPAYKNILINSAKALSTRFNATTGCIKSWNRFKSWHGNATYYYPVIIDNMMNLEMLFFASKVSGDDRYKNIAIKHAETTMKNHFRPDFSSYHVVCYDSTTGKVVARETAQGYADNSTWSRGQAWAIYGFTMTYRETTDDRFLKTAMGLADYFIKNKNLPKDGIPYWDFNAYQAGFTPGVKSNANKVSKDYRDASAAAITASALLELSTYVTGSKIGEYKKAALKMLHSLASDSYRAKAGTNGNFILEHSVGSIPHDNEMDVPLVYADYYFLEALLRYSRLQKGQPLF